MIRRQNGVREWLSPVIHLSNNWISRVGVVLVTTATILWLFLLPTSLRGEVQHPYIGILGFLILPGVFFAGLALIPLGIWLRRRSERASGLEPDLSLPISLKNPDVRRLVLFIGLTTFANIVIGSQLTYRAVTFMESVSFCGQTCHTVMKPEFTAYQGSPHSRVECVACHIGAGASWFVKSKLSGVRQVFAVALNTYPRPIPTPVRNLRPARETCEACHWPQKYGEDRLRVVNKFADDETNTRTKTVLLMRIGGGHGLRPEGPGIHGAHLGPGIRIEYLHSDESRQTIPQVEYHNDTTKRSEVYVAADAKPDAIKTASRRLMDCMDCHNRPTHTLSLPDRAVDTAMAAGEISPSLPWVKKQGVEILKQTYATNERAAVEIPAALDRFYKGSHPDLYAQRKADIARAGTALAAIYNRNVFPEMKVNWGSYPNNIGHTDFPGCFRCHDDNHASAGGKKIMQDCNGCHQLLAMDEADPKILTDLGLQSGAAK